MRTYLQKLGAGVLLLMTLIACSHNPGVKVLKVLPEKPAKAFLFQTCIQHGIEYPCLDEKNALAFISYLRDVDIYIGMVEGMRE